MSLISRTCLALVVCSILTACSSPKQPEPPKKAYVDVPIEDTLRASNVRDNVVLHTHESIGGAAERQTEWADYFYDTYHTGVSQKAPGAEAISEDSLVQTSEKSVSKDRSVYADRSIYSMNKAKKKAKKSASKKKAAKKTAVNKKATTGKKITNKKSAKKSNVKKIEGKALKSVKSTVVNGKKVSETIVELKDAQ